MRLVIACLLAVAAFFHAALADDFPPSSIIFGPLPAQKTVLLGLDQNSVPPTPIKLVCSFYPRFTVKDLSTADIGDEIAFAPANAPCQRRGAQGTIALKTLDFPATLWGAIGGYAFVLGDDGINGGEAFAVIDPKSAKILAENTAYPAAAHASLIPGGLAFDFTAQLDLDCSLTAPGAKCAATVQQQTGLKVPMPLCLKQYRQTQAEIDSQCRAKNAPGWCATSAADARTDPSVINYPARLTILNGVLKTTATGPISDCFASQ